MVDTVNLSQLAVVSTECTAVEEPKLWFTVAVARELMLETVMVSMQAVVITKEPYASLLETTVKWLQPVIDSEEKTLLVSELTLDVTTLL